MVFLRRSECASFGRDTSDAAISFCRTQDLVAHSIEALIRQRVHGLALGCEEGYRPRDAMENRVKERQPDLFADRTSTHTFRADHLRACSSSLAYVPVSRLPRVGLKGTPMANATCGSIRAPAGRSPGPPERLVADLTFPATRRHYRRW